VPQTGADVLLPSESHPPSALFIVGARLCGTMDVTQGADPPCGLYPRETIGMLNDCIRRPLRGIRVVVTGDDMRKGHKRTRRLISTSLSLILVTSQSEFSGPTLCLFS
jgi:hypothetical protein